MHEGEPKIPDTRETVETRGSGGCGICGSGKGHHPGCPNGQG